MLVRIVTDAHDVRMYVALVAEIVKWLSAYHNKNSHDSILQVLVST